MNDRPSIIQYKKFGAVHIKICENQVTNDDQLSGRSLSDSHDKCAVRTCSNTLKDEPCKIFFPFPSHQSLRASWFRACGLDINNPPKFALHCCEVHFDLKREVKTDANVAALRNAAGIGGVISDLLKDRVVPHRQVADNPLWTQSLPHSPSIPSSEMSGPHSWHQPASSPGVRPPVIQRTGGSDTTGPSTSSGPKIRVKSVEELKNIPVAPVSSPSSLQKPPAKRGRPPNSSKVKTARDSSAMSKECIVSGCPSNLRTFPNAKFICVPFAEATRKLWFASIGRSIASDPALSKETVYFCTDHFKPSDLESFKLPKDENAVHVRVKHGVLPSLKLGVETNDDKPGPEIVPPRPSTAPTAKNTASAPKPVVKPVQLSAPVPVVKPQKNEERPKSPEKAAPIKKPTNVVLPTCKKYEPKDMPQYPECKPPCPSGFHCSSVTRVEYSAFYSHFHSLDTRAEQNEFIFSHTEVNSDNPFPDMPGFKFFVDVKSPPNPSPLARVCALAFATSLSLQVEVILGLVIQNKDRVRNGSNPPIIPTLRLEVVKTEDGTDDVMVYTPVPEAIEVSSDSEEDRRRTAVKEEPSSETETPVKEEAEVKIEPESPAKSCPPATERPPTAEFPNIRGPSNPVDASSLRQDKEKNHEKKQPTSLGTSSSGKRPSSALDTDTSLPTDSGSDEYESMHLCSRCLAQFKSRLAFEEHERLQNCKKHSGTYFNCETCGRTYYKFDDLKTHTNIIHRYVCPKCSDSFRHRRYLENHVVECKGTNELSEKMRILIKNTESKTDTPPHKKHKTDMSQSSIACHRQLPVLSNNLKCGTTPSLLRPAVLKLHHQIKIPKPSQALKLSALQKCRGGTKKRLISQTKSVSHVSKSAAIIQQLSEGKSSSPVTRKETKNMAPFTKPSQQPVVPKTDGTQLLQNHTQQVPNPFSNPKNQLKFPHQTEQISNSSTDAAKVSERPHLMQGYPGTEANRFQHVNPAPGTSNGFQLGNTTPRTTPSEANRFQHGNPAPGTSDRLLQRNAASGTTTSEANMFQNEHPAPGTANRFQQWKPVTRTTMGEANRFQLGNPAPGTSSRFLQGNSASGTTMSEANLFQKGNPAPGTSSGFQLGNTTTGTTLSEENRFQHGNRAPGTSKRFQQGNSASGTTTIEANMFQNGNPAPGTANRIQQKNPAAGATIGEANSFQQGKPAPGTTTSEANKFQHDNPAQSFSISKSVLGGLTTSPLGINFPPIKPAKSRTLHDLNDSLPDFYKLIQDSPTCLQKPLVRTSQPSLHMQPARLTLQQQENNTEQQLSFNDYGSTRNRVPLLGPHDHSQDGFTLDIRSSRHCHVHAHNGGMTVTIHNRPQQDQSSRESQEARIYGEGTSDMRFFSQSPIFSRQSQSLHPPFAPSPVLDTLHQPSLPMGPGAWSQWRPAGQVQSVSSQKLPYPTNSVAPPGQSHKTFQLPLALHPAQPQLPIPALLDLDVQPPLHIKHRPKKSKAARHKRFRAQGMLTPLSLLCSPNGIPIRNLCIEEVSRAEETTNISQEQLDVNHFCRSRSVGSQTTLPLIASESSRVQKPSKIVYPNSKCTITSVHLLRTNEGDPITNFSDEDIAFFEKAINISKVLVEGPNRRSIASQTTLPLIANETSRVTASKEVPCQDSVPEMGDKTSEITNQPNIRSFACKHTITEHSLLLFKGKPIENFTEDYIARAEDNINVAYEQSVEPNKRSIASQTTFPLVASEMLRQKRLPRQQRRVMNFFQNYWDPNVPITSQPGWLLKQPSAESIPNPCCIGQPTGFDFVTRCRCKRKCRSRVERCVPYALPSTDISQSNCVDAPSSSRQFGPRLPVPHYGDATSANPTQIDSGNKPSQHFGGASGECSGSNRPDEPVQSQDADVAGMDSGFY